MPSFRRVLRAVIAAALALAVWTLARPALAAPAPLCDDRGASALAPAPILEATDVAVQVLRAASPGACSQEDLPLGATIAPGHRAAPSPPPSAEPALPRLPLVLVPPAGDELTDVPDAPPQGGGVRSHVERPPRG